MKYIPSLTAMTGTSFSVIDISDAQLNVQNQLEQDKQLQCHPYYDGNYVITFMYLFELGDDVLIALLP